MARDNRKHYDETFKKETVKYIAENNKPVAQAAREMKIPFMVGLRNMAINQK